MVCGSVCARALGLANRVSRSSRSNHERSEPLSMVYKVDSGDIYTSEYKRLLLDKK